MIHVYTGPGKGKTTAAFGLGLRAAGRGWNVKMIQFMKGDEHCGEIQSLKHIPNFDVEQYGRKSFVKKGRAEDEDIRLANKGFQKAQEEVLKKSCQMLILDELNSALDFGLLDASKVTEWIRQLPNEIELVITGRNALPEIIRLADLVSEIKEVKHYFQQGVPARKGVEY